MLGRGGQESQRSHHQDPARGLRSPGGGHRKGQQRESCSRRTTTGKKTKIIFSIVINPNFL